jgi:hypothetical protein
MAATINAGFEDNGVGNIIEGAPFSPKTNNAASSTCSAGMMNIILARASARLAPDVGTG